MAFVVIAVIMILLKLAGINPVAAWSWWIVLAPLPCAVVWWSVSDATGRTARLAMEREDARKEKRRLEAMAKLGIGPKKDR